MGNTKAVLFETALVAALGLVFALAANALSPRGLRLSRDYFPGGGKLATPVATGTNAATTSANPGSTDPLGHSAAVGRTRPATDWQQRGRGVVSGPPV